jgi:quercetin dioxygenase-like cupin family protein
MTRTTSFTTAALLAAMLSAVAAQAPAPFKRTVLQQGDLSAPGREAVMALAEIQPAAAAGRHTHPGEEIAYVLAGPVVIEIDGKPAKTYQTGEVFMIPPGAVHNAKNPGPAAVKIVSTYVIEKGKPVATPVQ